MRAGRLVGRRRDATCRCSPPISPAIRSLPRDRDFTANADLRSRLPAAGRLTPTVGRQFNNTSITSAWGIFDRFTPGNIIVNGTVVTDGHGRPVPHPAEHAARLPLADRQWRVDNNWTLLRSTITIPRRPTSNGRLRYRSCNTQCDRRRNGVDRYNLFAFFNHDFDDNLELFAEAGVYLADSVGYRESAPMLGAVPIVIPATQLLQSVRPRGLAQPAGRTTHGAGARSCARFADGHVAYRPIDAGPRKTEVENLSTRVLAGLRGDWRGLELGIGAALFEGQRRKTGRTASPTRCSSRRSRARRRMPTTRSTAAASTIFAAATARRVQLAAINSFTVPVFRRNEHVDRLVGLQGLAAGPVHAVGGRCRRGLRRRGAPRDVQGRSRSAPGRHDPVHDIISRPAPTNDLQGNNQSLDTTRQPRRAVGLCGIAGAAGVART